MMKSKRIYFSLILLGVVFFILLQAACRNQRQIESIFTTTPTETSVALGPTYTSVSASILTPDTRPSLNPTIDSAQQIWHTTAIAVQETERAVSQQSLNGRETQIANFSIACEDINLYSSNISPDEKWFAVSCGYNRNQTLIVQNKEGTKWVLEFKDFVSQESLQDIPGLLSPKFWSPDGEYLYFKIGLGYSGGGNDCFPSREDYGNHGLFRLSLKTGSWVTVVPPTDSFRGYEIEFSPTGRRYATTMMTMNGVMITDLQTGNLVRIETNRVIEALSWSPNGKYLAYSLAICDDKGTIQSSSAYIWDALMNQTQMLFKTDEVVLRAESWTDNSTIRIIGEKINDFDSLYTIYHYDISQDILVFTGTATPSP